MQRKYGDKKLFARTANRKLPKIKTKKQTKCEKTLETKTRSLS